MSKYFFQTVNKKTRFARYYIDGKKVSEQEFREGVSQNAHVRRVDYFATRKCNKTGTLRCPK